MFFVFKFDIPFLFSGRILDGSQRFVFVFGIFVKSGMVLEKQINEDNRLLHFFWDGEMFCKLYKPKKVWGKGVACAKGQIGLPVFLIIGCFSYIHCFTKRRENDGSARGRADPSYNGVASGDLLQHIRHSLADFCWGFYGAHTS